MAEKSIRAINRVITLKVAFCNFSDKSAKFTLDTRHVTLSERRFDSSSYFCWPKAGLYSLVPVFGGLLPMVAESMFNRTNFFCELIDRWIFAGRVPTASVL